MDDSLDLELVENQIEDVVEAIKRESYLDIRRAKNIIDDYKSANSVIRYVSCNCMKDWCSNPFLHGLQIDGKRLVDLERSR